MGQQPVSFDHVLEIKRSGALQAVLIWLAVLRGAIEQAHAAPSRPESPPGQIWA